MTIMFHIHQYTTLSGTHCGYVFNMFVSRTKCYDENVKKNAFVGCAYNKLLSVNLHFSCDRIFFIHI